MRFVRRALVAAVLVPLAVSCAQVLGIEEARHDPKLDEKSASTADASTDFCETYCRTVASACHGTDEQYPLDVAGTGHVSTMCYDLCSKLPVGSPSDMSGNTMGCRMNFALAAANDAKVASGAEVGALDAECRAAGPGGNGVCGSNCDALCTLAGPTCKNERDQMTLGEQVVLNETACRVECATLPDTKDYNDDTAHQSGGSVQCRLYHVTAAQPPEDSAFHCPHVGGASPCSGIPTVNDAGKLL